jgi:hypothetical protein
MSNLLDKDVNFIRQSYPSPTDTGKPQHYGYWDQNTFILGPTPDLAYQMELHYFYYPESIVTAGTSWLGDNFDSVLLYGALLEAAAFMKSDPDVIANYRQRFDEAMIMLKQLAEGKNRSDAYRKRSVQDTGAMIVQTQTTSFKAELYEGIHDLIDDTIKIALFNANADLSASTTAYSTNQEVTGTGYTAGGIR